MNSDNNVSSVVVGSANNQEPKPDENEPPPPYPGLSADTMPAAPPPSYAAATVAPPPGPTFYSYSGVGEPPQQPPVYVPQFLPLSHHTPITAAPARLGNCPNCHQSSLVASVDIALVICLVIFAFLLTPFTLCCIPCAFRQECPVCGYRTG